MPTVRARDYSPSTYGEVIVNYCALPSYREAFARCLLMAKRKVSFLVGRSQFDETVTTDFECPNVHELAVNHYLFGRRLLWQGRIFKPTLAAALAVVELNPRSLNSWGCLFCRLLLRRPTLVWGHAWPRAGRNTRSDRVRGLQRWLSSGILTYTQQDADALAEAGCRRPIFVVPNSLYYRRQLGARNRNADNIVYVGRLVSKKRPALLIQAFAVIAEKMPDTNLIIVGDGPERAHLESLAVELRIEEKVQFRGHVMDPDLLSSIYQGAFCAVSPGYVGLNATQALGYGVPLIWPDAEAHAPEVAILQEGRNSRKFSARDHFALAGALLEQYIERLAWDQRRFEISEEISERFSAEAMAEAFLRAADVLLGPASSSPN